MDSFLVVVEEQTTGYNNNAYYTRTVKNFSPSDSVTKTEFADMAGWKKIFEEFKPKKITKNKKRFKFEDLN